MNKNVINLLKDKNYIMPSYLLKNYKKIGLTSDLFVLVCYLINLDNPIVCDYKRFSNDLNIEQLEVMNMINDLTLKKMIEIDVKKNSSSKLEEYINLDLLYNKLFMLIIDEEETDDDSIYGIFERELNRSLSPIEYELVNGWLDCGYKKDIIISALKEAVFNGANNFRYIDKILSEWNKKGIDTLEKVEKNKREFKKSVNKVEVPDYDWLNQNE